MAPVGGNGSYIPRLDPDEIKSRKASLAITQSNASSALSNVNNPSNRAYRNGRVGGGANTSDVGSATRVDNTPEASGVATDPYGVKSTTPDQDSITLSPRCQRAIAARRAAGTLPPNPAVTGLFGAHGPTVKFNAGGQIWSNSKHVLADAQVEVTASGLYSVTAAVQPPVQPTKPTTKPPARRSYGVALRMSPAGAAPAA